jgi:hypothetical protein
MNQQHDGEWRELSRLWQGNVAPVTVEDIERLHVLQHRRLRAITAAELTVTALGIAAAFWLAFVSRFLWVGVLTATFAAASAVVFLRARRLPSPPGSRDLLQSLKGSLAYQDWLAEQLRYGRGLSFVALFAIVIAASEQLMHVATVPPMRLLATAAAGAAVVAALAWNVALAWKAWRRKARLTGFIEKLVADQAGQPPAP